MFTPSIARHQFVWLVLLLAVLALPLFAQAPAPAPQPTVAPATSTPVQFIFNGYVQGRYTDLIGDGSAAGTFDAKRGYVNLRVQVDQHVAASFMVGAFPTMKVYEAYGEYAFNPIWKSRIGLNRIPFGYEIPLSSSRLITLERAQVTSVLLYKDYTFERGLFAYYTPKGPIDVAAALVNGDKIDTVTDPNEVKNIVARVGYKLPGGTIGASIYNGKDETDATLDRLGADLEITRGSFSVLSEYLYGKTAAVKSDGAYLTLAYQKPGTRWQPYLRADVFNPNRDVAGDYFERGTIGANYFPTKATRLTLEYQTIKDNANSDNDGAIAAQYQVSF